MNTDVDVCEAFSDHFSFYLSGMQLCTDECLGNLRNPPSRETMLEVDRSLLLYNTPAFNPRTEEAARDSTSSTAVCQDGSPAVLRKPVIVTLEAKISRHGLPLFVVSELSLGPLISSLC